MLLQIKAIFKIQDKLFRWILKDHKANFGLLLDLQGILSMGRLVVVAEAC